MIPWHHFRVYDTKLRFCFNSTSTTALLDKGQEVRRQPCIALPLVLLK